MTVEIVPSVLAADFLRLGESIRTVDEGGAHRVQIDVMDGRFVPNITMGPDLVAAARAVTSMVIEAHLMIVEPEKFVPVFAQAGADVIIVHQEASPHIYRTLEQIRELGKGAGVAINPGTPSEVLSEVLHLADVVLVMTVNPGFGGQKFIESMLPKIAKVREALEDKGATALVEVDGGINLETAPRVTSAGAQLLVAGTSVYRAPSGVAPAIAALQNAAQGAMTAGVRE
jgi:ribulose-phosphate 3-epimerase